MHAACLAAKCGCFIKEIAFAIDAKDPATSAVHLSYSS